MIRVRKQVSTRVQFARIVRTKSVRQASVFTQLSVFLAADTCVIDPSTARINRLQQLIHLVVTHFLAQVRQD